MQTAGDLQLTPRAVVDARAGALVAMLPAGAGRDVRAALRDAVVVRGTCSRAGRGTRRPHTAACTSRPCSRSRWGSCRSCRPCRRSCCPCRCRPRRRWAGRTRRRRTPARPCTQRACACRCPRRPGSGGQARAKAGRPRSRERPVVDDAVAVVVDAVADLGLRHAGDVADQLAVLADDGPGLADAQAVAALLADARERPFVNLAVAVVVDAVADLGCCGVMIGALQTVSVPARVADQRPSRLQAPLRPLLHFVPTATGRASCRCRWCRRSCRRGRCRSPAGRRSRTVRRRRWGAALVDLAVAVVVLAVAGLDGAVVGGGAQLVVGVVRIVRAVREAAAVGVRVPRRALAAGVRDAFVDVAVAVVVLAVADLDRRDVLRDDADDGALGRVRVVQRHADRGARAARRRDGVVLRCRPSVSVMT